MATASHYSAAELMRRSPILPVLVIERLDDALPLAQALLAGGIDIIEITLRTACALDAIRLIREALPQMVVGAGTVLSDSDVSAVQQAGGQFIVTPGATVELLHACKASGLPTIAGVATVSEAMTARAIGFKHLKFFPAEANGGVATLKSMAAPLADIEFCATGGINPNNLNDYLALPCVPCIGGTWLTPKAAIDQGDWAQITALTQTALATCANLARSA